MNKKDDAPVKKRLLEFLKENGVERAVFCTKTGICDSILRKKDSEISTMNLVRIGAAYPNLSMDWLITGIGSRIKNVPEDSVIVNVSDILEMAKALTREVSEVAEANKKLVSTQAQLLLFYEGKVNLVNEKEKPTIEPTNE